jgi:hypothetical protein
MTGENGAPPIRNGEKEISPLSIFVRIYRETLLYDHLYSTTCFFVLCLFKKKAVE